jgi:hypothetical protein
MGGWPDSEIVSGPNEYGEVWVKTGEIPDVLDGKTVGVEFQDPNDLTSEYRLDNFSPDPEGDGTALADLSIRDVESEFTSKERIRLKRHLREATVLSWENFDNSKTWRSIGKVAAGTTAVVVGAMTLYKIRKSRNGE